MGASRWRIFREIQLPLLRPVIFLALILRFLEAMARLSGLALENARLHQTLKSDYEILVADRFRVDDDQ